MASFRSLRRAALSSRRLLVVPSAFGSLLEPTSQNSFGHGRRAALTVEPRPNVRSVTVPFSDISVLLTHAAATIFMAGVIWTIQLVHYPLFVYADRGRFTPFHDEHSRRITWIVGVGMGFELISAIALVVSAPERVGRPLVVVALGVLALVHAATVMLSVPSHNRLGRGWDDTAHHRLVSTNWVRTLGWSVRAGLALVMIARYSAPLSR